MAVETRPKHSQYYSPMAMDPSMVDMFSFPVDNMAYPQLSDYPRAPQSYFDPSGLYTEHSDLPKGSNFPAMPATPPSIATSQPEPQIPTGSAASGPSIATYHDNWVNTNHGLGLPVAVMHDIFPNEYMGNNVDYDGFYREKLTDTFVDPNVIQPVQAVPAFTQPLLILRPDSHILSCAQLPPQSPATSEQQQQQSPVIHPIPQQSPQMLNGEYSRPASVYDRRSSISSTRSRRSQQSPGLSSVDADDDVKEKGRCPHPDCGRVFKDLKAHMLTHQSERPEKCPIVTCEYHTKGFARKYDKNRHTLTHYKGTMVCGFCPGSGSPAEKSFNRADVFKRHLTSLHGVEQTPPNCRKRSPGSSTKKGTNYSSDATGKCSTCSATFSNAQDFYEHLDDCVLRVVQQEEPSEAINQQRLAEVVSDEDVKKTMEKHHLLDVAGHVEQYDDNDSNDEDDSHDSNWRSGRGGLKSTKGNPASSQLFHWHGKGNRPVPTRRRNNRGNYPQSWGCPNSSMKTKKRVLCVFDGPRRLWKDEMMLNNDFEVRLRLPGGAGDGTNRDAYVTDLDMETMKRAEGVHSANEDERGPWLDGPSTHLMGQPARLFPDPYQSPDDEVYDLMS
ncbi:hypothetical protein N7470_001217 [Penicillium chermesinum]|nr:hypothetical protein N7470_001217 [Penicillium chermesinum]